MPQCSNLQSWLEFVVNSEMSSDAASNMGNDYKQANLENESEHAGVEKEPEVQTQIEYVPPLNSNNSIERFESLEIDSVETMDELKKWLESNAEDSTDTELSNLFLPLYVVLLKTNRYDV